MCLNFRAKSAVVGADTELMEKNVSSKPSYEAIMQQIAYLMCAVANQTNLNPTKTGGHTGFKPNGNSKYPSNTFQRPKHNRKNMTCWGCGGTGHSWRECSTLRDEGIISPLDSNPPIANSGTRPNLNGQQGEEIPTSNPFPVTTMGGVHINGELRPIGVWDYSDYYNPNPWARILGRVNKTDVEIDGIISKALIDSGAMISMMSRNY